LSALQTVSIVSALPFAVVLLIAMVGMWRALVIEEHRTESLAQDNRLPPHLLNPGSWRDRLDYLTDQPTKTEVLTYIQQVVKPAMEQVSERLTQKGWATDVAYDEVNSRVYLDLKRGEDVDFWYEVRVAEHETPDYY